MNSIRKNITLPVDIYHTINEYVKERGISFSEFVRDAAVKAIIQEEKASLLEYLDANCLYLDKDEQKEIERLSIDFENLDGKELTLDELLQS